ncbi:MAG: S1 family peptidase [Streptomyces sp.]|uniref:S1 family peptidase n=1 Tax=Streptomyces sp. TaxID=1931 RepID=UPI003D6AD846
MRRSTDGPRGTAGLRRVTAGTALLLLSLLGPAPGAAAAHLSAAPGGTGESSAGPRQFTLRGGDPIYAAGRVCTLSFNATDGTSDYAITPGRCTSGAGTWYADPAMTVPFGSTAGTSFPGNDYGLIRYTNPGVAHPGEVDTGSGDPLDITGAGSPAVGQQVCHVGRVSGLHCGTVQAVNVSVSYPEGTVNGLFRSTAPSEPGDAGGPAFSGSTALGFIVGSGGGSTFYQPITEVLSAYGLTLT